MAKPVINIAFQGAAHSFSHLAVLRLQQRGQLGQLEDVQVHYLETRRFRQVFDLVASGSADFGVVPIENSIAGSIYEVYDLLTQFELNIVAEQVLRVEHQLLVLNDCPALQHVKKVLSHPKALEQCTQIFDANQDLEQVVWSDTAGAAKYVASMGDTSLAAIASTEAGCAYGLKVMLANIEDSPYNVTRFVVITKSAIFTVPTVPVPQDEVRYKFSLAFELPDIPGSLAHVLTHFAQLGVNLTKIESRPKQNMPFQYIFYADLVLTSVARQELTLKLPGLVANYKELGWYQVFVESEEAVH